MGDPPGIAKAIFFIFCLVLTNASASKCKVGCHGMQSGKAYQEGQTYIYDLEGTSVTSVSGAQGEASLKLKATVELSAKADCVQQLRLKGVQLNGAPVSSADVEKYAIQFNYHNGHIDSELCAEEGDTQVSLNIKRAVVSMFQSAVLQDSGSTTHHETDIFGGCPTDFAFHKEGDSLIVQKYRNLGQCSYRENINQGFITANFDPSSDIQTSPLLSSTQKIEQRFKRGILNKAQSTETYKYKPFSNGDAGAQTVIETTLTLKGEKGDNPTASVSLPKSLIFEAPHPVIKSSVDSITTALRSAKSEETGDVKPEAASKFSALVRVLRRSSKNDILSVYQKVRAGAGFDKSTDLKLFLDALFHAGSGEAAEVAVDLIKNRELSGMQSLMFYGSLALIGHVNLPSVTAVTSLLDQPNLPRIAYLGIGQVIGKYCQQHSCENVPEVNQAIHKIREKVGNGKAANREQENEIVSGLKALGNTRFLDDATLQKLANIAADKSAKNRVRVAAIEALPARCSMKWKSTLLKVLGDREEDSEIRIKAYLSLVSCACPHVANQLKEILDKETVNQVGSFIQTHLRNLRASTDPSKENAKRQLGLIKPREKFPEDFRKFSFNNELSYHVDAYGLGSTVESNVIYSQNSFVPRSANLNLTTELFGRSFNFLELSTRVENLDRVLEHHFGPKGEVTTYDFADLSGDSVAKAMDISGYIKKTIQKLRGKREVKQGELDRFAKNVKLGGGDEDDLDIDVSMKLFGIELAYLSYQGDPNKMNYEHVIDKIFEAVQKGMDKVKNFNYDLQNHLHFLDGELIYPTGLGASMSLGLTGTSVVHLKTSGKIDLASILNHPENAAVKLDVEPSASIQITGSLMVHSFDVESGMKLVSTLHTQQGMGATVALLNGKGIDVNLAVLKKKEVLISITSDVLMTSKQDQYIAPKFPKGKEYSDCFDQFSTLIGSTPCWQIYFPYENVESMQKRPFFPLSGPAKFAITFDNNDVANYHFKVHYDTEKPKAYSFEVVLDTPNSKTNRRISLDVEAGLGPDKYAKISLDSPIKKASLEGVLKNTAEERTLTVNLLHDNMKYFVKTGILASGNNYKPILEYKVPEHIERLTNIKGEKNGQQYNVEGTVNVVDHEGGKKFDFDKVAFLIGGKKMIGIDGAVISTPNAALVDTKIGYGDETVALKLNGKRIEERNYEVSLSAIPSKDPSIGFDVNWYWKRTPGALEHKFAFVHGGDPKANRFEIEQNYVYNLQPEDLLLSAKNRVSYAPLQLLVKLDGKATRKSIGGDFELKYEKFKLGAELDAKVNSEKPGDYEVEFEAEILENSVELKSKRKIIDPHKSEFKNSLVLKPGGKYEADGTLTYDVSKNNINVQLDGDLNLNGKKAKVNSGLEANPQLVNSRALLNIDDAKYIDFVLILRRGPNPNGKLNLALKDYVTALGEFNYEGGKGSGKLNIDLPRINRKVKGTGDLSIDGSSHTANVELLYDAEKDPSKSIKLHTVSDISKTNVNSHVVLEVLSYKVELNAKGKLQGTLNDGQVSGDADLTLPNGRYFTYKFKRNMAKKGDKYDGDINVELADFVKKGGESRKLSYVGRASNVDPKTRSITGNGQVKFVNYSGKDVVLGWVVKSAPKGENGMEGELKVNLGGSSIPKPFKFEGEGSYAPKEVSYKGKSSLGNDFSAQCTVDYTRATGTEKPSTLSYTVDMKLPSDKLRNFKLKHSESLLEPIVEGGVYELTGSSSLTYNDDKTVAVEGYVKASGSADPKQSGEGTAKFAITILKNPTLTFGGTYKHDPTGEKKKTSYTGNVNYGDMEATAATNAEYLPDFTYINANTKVTLPLERLKEVDLQLNHKSEDEGKRRKTELVVNTPEGKYTGMSDLQIDEGAKMMHALFTSPSSKAEVLLKSQRHGEYKGEWKVHTPKGYIVADTLINLESVDNFVINANFDSDQIKPSKIHAEIANKPTAKNGKRIVITVTSDGKNIVTGSTNYKRKDEDGKIVVEGNGSLKIGENVRSSSFKYTKKELTKETDGEVGVAIQLNANFGPSAIVGELKLSNKEVHVFNSYCEETKDCAHFKLESTLDTDHKTHFKHQITLEVDLKKFNVPAEFGLKTNTEYKNFVFDHTASLYLHSSKDKSEYSYQLYVHPKDSAVIVTLPSRELAYILTFEIPKTKQTGAYKLDSSLYLDRKNKPNEKTSLTATGDFNVDKNSLSLSGETKFVYPSQTKDMLVKGRLHYGGEHLLDANVDVDVFAKKSQKITLVAKVQKEQLKSGYNMTSIFELTSRGQQLKVDLKSHLAASSEEIGFGSFLTYNDIHQKPKDLGVLFSADLKRIFFLITAPNKELLKAESNMDLKKDVQKIDTEVTVLDNKPDVYNVEVDGFSGFKYTSYNKENPNTKLTANGRIVLGQLAEVHADAYKDGAKKNLFHFMVHLDEEKFLKPDFGYNKDNIVALTDHFKNRKTQLLNQLNDLNKEMGDEAQREFKDLFEHLKKAQPNTKPLIDYYTTELNKIKDELHADETVKEIQATLNKHFGEIVKAFASTAKEVAERLKGLQKEFAEILATIEKTAKAVYPQLKDLYDTIVRSVITVSDAFANLFLVYVKAIITVINQHQNELKELMAMVTDFAQDIAKIVFRAIGQVKQDLDEFVTLLMNQLRVLPLYEILQEKYKEYSAYRVPEAVIGPIQEICNVAKAGLPTQELREFLDATCEYTIKHIKKEKVDEANELKRIYSMGVNAIRSIITMFQSRATVDNVFDFLRARVPVDLSFLSKLPGIFTLKVSALNLIRNRELPSPMDLYYAYRPTLNPKDIIPPFSMSGTVLDGGHFFTFDGRHFNMPGSCQYILAQDMYEGNFSVIANFDNGNLLSVTLTEPKESITIKSNGNILVNNKPAEYPADTKNLHAITKSEMPILLSEYGVTVSCAIEENMLCFVQVSGFYLGRVRGLLGDGNNEPYDDFTLPDGKITESESEFGNAYKLKADCPAATAVEHGKAPRAPTCTEYFSGETSSMKSCFNYVNPTQYRDACDQAVAAGTKNAACVVAGAYFSVCYTKRVFISLPSSCASCQVGANKVAIGDTFSVVIPKKEADVIFVVEQDTHNEKVFKDMISPMMNELREELKHHGITDVHIGLIGFGEKMKWPKHYTVNGNTNIEGEVKNMKFEEKDPIITLEEAQGPDIEKKAVYLGQRLDVELGTFKLTDAYEEAIRYPFRPGAAKAVVGVIAHPCEKSPFLLSFQHLRVLLGLKMYRDLGMTYYHVSGPGETLVSGKPQKNIVGYDHESAYIFADSKKKPLSGNTELKNNLRISTPDVCADFAVSSGGAAFRADNFLEGKPNQRKQFIQVAARRIADGMTNVELLEDCRCELQMGVFGRSRCKIVGRKEKEPLARHAKGGKTRK